MKTTKTVFIVLIIGLFNTSIIAQDALKFKVKGELTHHFEGYLYLKYADREDSFLVKDRSFEFEGMVSHPVEATLRKKGAYVTDSFYLEDGTTSIQISINDNVTSIESIDGNKTHQILLGLMAFFEENEDEPDFQQQMYDQLDKVITENPRNEFSGELLSEIIMDPIFSFEEAMSLYSKLDTVAQSQYSLNSLKVSLDKLKNTKIGNAFPTVQMPDALGNMVSTNDYKGSYLLIEFWASWCGGCRIANPELVKIREEFLPKGFDIMGISLDDSRTAWLKAIEKDGLTWENTMAEGAFKNKTIEELKIQYLPSNYLLDRQGNIVAINVKPTALQLKLKKLMDQESDK